MEFRRNPAREERAKTFRHKPESFGEDYGGLAIYFRTDPKEPQTPGDLPPDSDWPWFHRFGDGKYRDRNDPKMELGLEEQCETADLLAELCWSYRLDEDPRAGQLIEETRGDPVAIEVLRDMLEERGVTDLLALLRAGRRVVQYASWLSAWWFHHAQSIAGDYEIFDACEADWLDVQGDVPREWTRMGLLILRSSTDPEYNYNIPKREDLEDDGDWPPVSRREGAPPCPLPTEEEWELARKLVDRLDLDDEDLSPTLFDYFC